MKTQIIFAVTILVSLGLLLGGCSQGAGKSFTASWTGFSESSFQSSGPVSIAFAAQQVAAEQTTALTIILKDSNGKGISGTVTLKSLQSGKFFPPPDGTSQANTPINKVSFTEDDDGFRQVYYSPETTLGLHTVTATYETHTATATITAVSAVEKKHSISLTPGKTSLRTGEEIILQVIVTDQSGNPPPDDSTIVINSSMNNTIKTGDTAAISFPLTNGRANMIYKAGITPGTDSVSVVYADASKTVDLNITADSSSTPQYKITLEPASSIIKTGENTVLKVSAFDQNSNPLPDDQKVLITSAMNNTVKVDDTAATSFTLSKGRANLVYTAGFNAGTDKLQAFVGDASGSVDITIQAAPLYILEIVPLATTVALNSTTLVYVKIKSRLGTAVDPGQDIIISVTKGKLIDPGDNEVSSLILSSVTSEQSFTYVAKQTGTDTISAVSVNATAVEKAMEVTN